MNGKEYPPDSQEEIEQETQAKEAQEEAEAQGINSNYEQVLVDDLLHFEK